MGNKQYSVPSASTPGGGGSGTGANITTAGISAPSPQYIPNEAPPTVNAGLWTQDVNGSFHQQAGIDTTTTSAAGSGPTPPDGTLTWTRRMFFRDNQATTQTFKNSFLSVNHYAGVGTAQTNQDRALSVNMTNSSTPVGSIAIAANVIKFGITGNPPKWATGQHLVCTGLSTTVGLLINGQDLTVLTNDIAGHVVYCTGFTHADLSPTVDIGQLDQKLYSMAGIQCEVDVIGTPTLYAGNDTEMTAVSAQLAYTGTGTMATPAEGLCSFRGTTSRASTGIVTGAAYNFIGASLQCVNVNNSNSGSHYVGVLAQTFDASGGGETSGQGFGVSILAPGLDRFGNLNRGLMVGDYGTQANDWAIYVTGSKDSSACRFEGPVVLAGSHGVLRTARANGSAPGNVDAAGVLVFAAVTSVSYTFTETYSVAPIVLITPVVPAGTTFELSALSTSGFTVTANQSFTGNVNYMTIGRN